MNGSCFGKWVSDEFEKVSLAVITSICLVSIVLNVLNIVIFSKPKMVSPTNSILLGIAVSDLSKVLMFLVTSACDQQPSFEYQVFYLACNVAMYLMHAFALWCGVLLALFRLCYLRYYASPRTKIWFGLARARLAICLVFAANSVALTPYAASLRIVADNRTGSVAFTPSLAPGAGFGILLFNSFAQKMLPCLIMTGFCFSIIRSLRQTERRRESLANLSGRSRGSEAANSSCRSKRSRRERRSRDHRRTTSFLLVIMALYIAYEIPVSVLIILSNPTFQLASVECFFYSFAKLLNTLGLVNNSVNFVLYCFMSKQFREVFKQTFCFRQLLQRKSTATSGTQASLRSSRNSRTSRNSRNSRTSGNSRLGVGSFAHGGSFRSALTPDDEKSCISFSEFPSNACLDY